MKNCQISIRQSLGDEVENISALERPQNCQLNPIVRRLYCDLFRLTLTISRRNYLQKLCRCFRAWAYKAFQGGNNNDKCTTKGTYDRYEDKYKGHLDHTFTAKGAGQVKWLEFVDNVAELNLGSFTDQIDIESGFAIDSSGWCKVLIRDIFDIHLN